jgi:hypothetical protein
VVLVEVDLKEDQEVLHLVVLVEVDLKEDPEEPRGEDEEAVDLKEAREVLHQVVVEEVDQEELHSQVLVVNHQVDQVELPVVVL